MRKLSLIVLAVASAGCSLSMKAERTWRAGEDTAVPLVAVTGTQESSGLARILFDGQVVAEGVLTERGEGEITGTWHDQSVIGLCGKAPVPEGSGGNGAASGGKRGAIDLLGPSAVDYKMGDKSQSPPNQTPMPPRPGEEASTMRTPPQPPRYCAITVGEHDPFSLYFYHW